MKVEINIKKDGDVVAARMVHNLDGGADRHFSTNVEYQGRASITDAILEVTARCVTELVLAYPVVGR